MKAFISLAASLAFLLSLPNTGWSDEAAVRQTLEKYIAAFNSKDLKAVASTWAANGVHIDRESGARTEGRDAIMADIKSAFEQQPALRLAGRIDQIRLLKSDVATVEGETSVGAPGEAPSVSVFSALLVLDNGRWTIHSIEESAAPNPVQAGEALRGLEWLVGRWVDETEASRVDTTVRWSSNGAFLIRSFAVRNDDNVTQQGTQIIGWDPRSREIRSWSFNSDGSFGDGVWSKNGDDWLIRSSQTLADGRAATGTYVLTRVDENAMQLKLIGHEIEGEPQPASPTVKVVRATEPAKNETPSTSSK
ncbi:MAG: SgcJ/EcaC family oxidoreductase [Planctomycetales bacterium]|nr:SgcJ/EcaC family oxidoreductase [Planctomycetales bacterium]